MTNDSTIQASSQPIPVNDLRKALPPGTRLICADRIFIIGKVIGCGGNALVYSANELKNGRVLPANLAIKEGFPVSCEHIRKDGVVYPFVDPDSFDQEMHISQEIANYVSGVYEIRSRLTVQTVEIEGQCFPGNGAVFMLMRNGSSSNTMLTLRDLFDEHGIGKEKFLPPYFASQLICALLQTLDKLHVCYLHGDLSINNLLWSIDEGIADSQVSAFLLDFGCARALDPMRGGITAEVDGSAPGTVRFSPPECFNSHRRALTKAFDLFSVAKLFWLMLIGEAAFNERHKNAIKSRRVVLPKVKLRDEEAALLQMAPDTLQRTNAFFAKATHELPGARYNTAREMLHDLRELQELLRPSPIPLDSPQDRSTPIIATRELLNTFGWTSLDIAKQLVDNDRALYPGIDDVNEGTPEQWASFIEAYPECWRFLYVPSEKRIVANWSFTTLDGDQKRRFVKGDLLEKDLDLTDTRCIFVPGEYHMFILNFSCNQSHQQSEFFDLLRQELYSQMLVLAQRGVYFKSIVVNAFSPFYCRFYQERGYKSVFKGPKNQIFTLDLHPFPSQIKHAELAEAYRKHFGQFEQLDEDDSLSAENLKQISDLIYCTDEYVYPAMVSNKKQLRSIMRDLLPSGKDNMFNLDNLFVAQKGGKIIGLILWHRGALKWSDKHFRAAAEKLDIELDPITFALVRDQYFAGYSTPTKKIQILNICVAPHYQGQGIGTSMLKAFVAEHSKDEFVLSVLADNESAIRCYENCGFTRCKEIVPGFSADSIKPDCLTMYTGAEPSHDRSTTSKKTKPGTSSLSALTPPSSSSGAQKTIQWKDNEPYIFISYSHKDSARVLPIINRMQQDGYRIWYDEGIEPGVEWADYIAAQLEHCRCFIAFLSAQYLSSNNCKDELKYCRDLDKPQLLVYLEEIKLTGGMAMRLNRVQAVFKCRYKSEGEFYSKLYSSEILFSCSSVCTREPSVTIPKSVSREQPKSESPASSSDEFDPELLHLQSMSQIKSKPTPQKSPKSDYASASIDMVNRAANGDAAMQLLLGDCFAYGEGVHQSWAEAAKWYRMAAEQGVAEAQWKLGKCYSNGCGVEWSKATAAMWYRKAAVAGYAAAQFELGMCYQDGEGVPFSEEKAVEWFQKAAEQGLANAQLVLGDCYYFGRGVPRDFIDAAVWFRKAAEQGHRQAQFVLGVCYFCGDGVPEDHAKSAKWIRMAAEQGHVDAQYSMGRHYSTGDGVSIDASEAVFWYGKAAEQGHTKSQYELGMCYEYGRGISMDLTQALYWYKSAYMQGNHAAGRRLKALRKKM